MARRSQFEKNNEAEVNELYKRLGERLKWAREAIPIGQDAFARELGMGRSKYSKVENAVPRYRPSLYDVTSMSIKLSVSADYLLFGTVLPAPFDETVRCRLVKMHPELLKEPRASGKVPLVAVPNAGIPKKRGPKPRASSHQQKGE